MAANPATDRQWWNKSDQSDIHSCALEAYNHLRQHDQRLDAYRTYMSLYTNRDISSDSLQSFFYAATDVAQNKFTRVPYNVSKVVVDTVASRVAKQRPRPMFLTENGNSSLQQRARRMQQWVDAQFYITGTYEKAVRAFVDAMVFGTGILKTFRQDKEVKVERIYPGEVFVDEVEGVYSDPRHIYQRKFIAKDVLTQLFPGMADEIEKSGFMYDRYHEELGYDPLVDQVEVVEAWHLPTRKGGKDGRTVMFISEGILSNGKYPHDDFPFSFVRWNEDLRGFFGVGLVEEVMGLHLDINNVIRKIERNIELIGTPQVWVNTGSKIAASKVSNVPGTVNTYSGEPPIWPDIKMVPGDVFEYLQSLIARVFQVAGLSDSAIGRGIPAGLETGAAVRNFHDIESERHSIVAKRFEDMFLDLARKQMRTGKEISQRFRGYTIVSEKDKHTVEKVPWKDVNLDDDKDAYVMKVFPASSLPTLPSGKLAFVQDMLAAQLIGPEEGKRLLDFPDLDAHLSLDRAASDNVDWIIEQILDEGNYIAPEPFMDLTLALKKAQSWILKAMRMGVPEENLSKLRTFAKQTNMLMQRAQQEAIAQQQALAPAPTSPPPAGPNGAPPTAVTGQELV